MALLILFFVAVSAQSGGDSDDFKDIIASEIFDDNEEGLGEEL